MRRILVLCAVGGCGFDIRAADGTQIDAAKVIDARIDDAVDAPPDPTADAAADAAIDAMIDAMVDAPVSTNCMQDPRYIAVGTTRYRQVPGVGNWLAAELICEGEGTHLVVFNSSTERGQADPAIVADAWIGVTDRVVEGTYRPVNGQPTVFLGTFNLTTPSEDCLQFDEGTDAIDDENCDGVAAIVCECDGLGVMAGSY